MTTVMRADRQLQIIARNELNEAVMATIVPVAGRLLIRTDKALYLVGESR